VNPPRPADYKRGMFQGSRKVLPSVRRGKGLSLLVAFLFLLLVISVFKNISYPLFWADESMTVMGGVRVLQFGYPKVHDGKNVFYDLQHPDKTLGIDRKTDAYIGGANWGQYYIAAVGVKLAELTKDIYTRTRIIRTLFALFGITGIILLGVLGSRFFPSGHDGKQFLALFFFIELISVPLILHLREARYYPLLVFLIAVLIFLYTKYRILKETGYPRYAVLSIIGLFLLFMTFAPAYFVFIGALGIFESLALAACLLPKDILRELTQSEPLPNRLEYLKLYLRNLLPCLLSIIMVSPFLVFFDTFHISEKLTEYYARGFQTDTMGLYLRNLSFIWDFFASSGLIYLAMILKILLLIFLVPKLFHDRNMDPAYANKTMFSLFLSIFFIMYFLLIPKIPTPFFTRYFISLQPILTIIIIMDVVVLFHLVSRHKSLVVRYARHALVGIFLAGLLVNISNNWPFIRGHFYELMHRYQGPLDHVIPFIQNRYGEKEGLVVATNYEETSYMYYLGAKVTVGYVGNNIEEDSRIQPDVIIYRKSWENFKPVFAKFIQNEPYEEISFPVVDYLVNNIPELHRQPPFCHQFETQLTTDEWRKTYIFIKK